MAKFKKGKKADGIPLSALLILEAEKHGFTAQEIALVKEGLALSERTGVIIYSIIIQQRGGIK